MRSMKVVKLNFNDIEEMIKDGKRVTVKAIAEEHGVSPLIIRRTLGDHYADKISFQRGRKGGIVLD